MKPPRDGWDHDERDAIDQIAAEVDALRARHAGDPPVDVLRAAGSDVLPEEADAAALRHLAASPWSRTLIEGLNSVEEPLDRQDADRLLARIRDQADRERRSISGWRWLPNWGLAAAGLAAAVIAAAWIQWPRPEPAPDPVVSSAAEAPPARRPSPPAGAYQLPLEPPPVMLGARALTWRGTGSADDRYLDLLKPGLDAFRAADFARAASELGALERRYPDGVEVFFYGGVAKLLASDPAGASATLARAEALGDDVFAGETAWYLAIADQRSGRNEKARERLDRICKEGGPVGARACRALETLGPVTPQAR